MKPLRLLVVHPEPKVAGQVRTWAEPLGYEVTVLPDGERAIDRFVLAPFDVIVVEYFLPGRDGVTTIESIRWAPRGRDVRVILLAETEPEIAPLAALGGRIDALETLVGGPHELELKKALQRALLPPNAVVTSAAIPNPEPPDFEDETGRPQVGPAPSKTQATRFDDESTVQGSAGVARAMLGPWTPGMTPPGTSPGLVPTGKLPSLLRSSPDAAPLREESTSQRNVAQLPKEPAAAQPPEPPSEEGPDGTRVARRRRVAAQAAPERTTGEWRRDAGALDEARVVSDEASREADVRHAGRFEETPFPEVLTKLAAEQATGALVCKQTSDSLRSPRETTTGDPPTKVVYFRAGVPTHVRSNLLDECLGQLLLRKKRIGRVTLEESIRRTLAGDGLQGEILIDMGALSPVEVSETLAAQATEKLYDLFGWRRGTYRLIEGEGKVGGLPIEQALPDIVYEGVCAAMPATQLLDLLTPHLEDFVIPDAQRLARFARVRLSTELRPVLAKIDGRAPLRVLLGAGGRPGGVAQMIYALHCLNAVRFEAAAHGRGPTPKEESDVGPAPSRGSPGEARRAPALPGLLPSKPQANADWDEDATAKESRKLPRAAPALEPTPPPRDVPSVHRIPAEMLEKMGTGSRVAPTPKGPAAPPSAASASPAPSHSAAAPVPVGPAPAKPVLHAAAPEAAAAAPAPPGEPPGPELDRKVDRLFEAERHFRRGNRALERQRWDEALSAFVRAHELVPTEGEFLAYVGWSRFSIDQAQGDSDGSARELALTELAQSADLSPELYVTHLLYARVLARLRRDGEARRAYERVLLLEPNNVEAKVALGQK